jgi:hypothetical protein
MEVATQMITNEMIFTDNFEEPVKVSWNPDIPQLVFELSNSNPSVVFDGNEALKLLGFLRQL